MAQAILGDFAFELLSLTFQDIDRSTTYRWAKSARVGRQPAMQAVGLDLDVINIRGVFYPSYRGGMGLVSPIRRIVTDGEPVNFTCTWERIAENLGRWTASDLSESRVILYNDAVPGKVNFSLKLTQYGEDETP